MWKPSKKEQKQMYQAELIGLLKNIKKVDGYVTYKVTGIQDDENILWWMSPRQIDLLQKLVEQELKRTKDKNYGY